VVSTSTEAIAALARGLGSWAEQSRGLWAQGTARVAAARGEIDRESAARANRVAALRQALRAAGDPAAAERIAADLAAAEAALARAERARTTAALAEQSFAAARRRAAGALEPALESGRADLQRRLGNLDAYLSGGGSGAAVPAATVPSGGLATRLAGLGLQEIDLSLVDFSGNPIAEPFGRGGLTITDYRWAAETWHTVVRPGVAAGLTRDDFAARDAERGARPPRSVAGVYDVFLGGDAIHVSRLPGGGWDVCGGRHRIEAARQLGLTTLPMRVAG
jgi:hypothetical protein